MSKIEIEQSQFFHLRDWIRQSHKQSQAVSDLILATQSLLGTLVDKSQNLQNSLANMESRLTDLYAESQSAVDQEQMHSTSTGWTLSGAKSVVDTLTYGTP